MTTWHRAAVSAMCGTDQKQRRAARRETSRRPICRCRCQGGRSGYRPSDRELNQRIRIISGEVDGAVLDAVEEEFADICLQNTIATEQLRKCSLRIFGLCSFLSSEGRRRNDQADTEGRRPVS